MQEPLSHRLRLLFDHGIVMFVYVLILCAFILRPIVIVNKTAFVFLIIERSN